MKKLLIPLIVIILGHSLAVAQVQKTAFTARIATLNTYIKQQNAIAQSEAFNQLILAMNTQMSYLNTQISNLTASYSADTAKAHTELKSRSATDVAAGRNEMQQANLLLPSIGHYQYLLATDKTLFNEIVPLKSNISANATALNNYLNQFDATL
ncbi:MAG: hypothetical protein ACHQIM_10360 [Sphingobacteriales bacterium]